MPDQPTININTKPNYFPWLIVLAVAIVLAIVLFKCHGTSQQYAQLQQDNAAILVDKERTQKEKTKDSIDFMERIQIVTDQRFDAQHNEDSVKSVLNTLQKNNKGLPQRILEYTTIECDTAYQHKCDSAARALLAASKSYDDLKLEDSLTKALYDYEIKIRNEYTADVQSYLDSCGMREIRGNALLNKALSMGKPKASLWFGGEGTNSIYYTSFGGVVAYVPKNGRIEYSLSGGPILKGNYYLQARVIAKIKLHK